MKKCSYWRLQLRSTFVLLSCNQDKADVYKFEYKIEPVGFALRKNCSDNVTMTKEED